ncbi:F-box family protein [Euphorbia peplus]|nr:F-box family protein [Euphorbia peplus]
MKLRFRSLQSKETQKLEVPDEFSIHELKQFLSNSLFSDSTLASSLRLSLNRKDELSSPSSGDSLLSIGMTSGDLIYYDLQGNNNISFNLQDRNIRNPIMDAKPYENSEQETLKSQIDDEKLEIEEFEDVGFVDLDGKRLSEPYFLRRVLCEDMGSDFSDTKLVFLAIHAVFLESGFVGFDSLSGLRVDLFDIMKEQVSMSFTTSVSYSLPELLLNDNDAESVVLKFQTLGHYVNVYGSLGGTDQLGLHKLNVDKSRFVPAIGTFWAMGDGCERLNEKGSSIADAEKVIFEFWKFVKDGLALPLLIDLCEKTGLDLPPCLIRLPADLKFRILELLPGQDVAKVACVCNEMKYLASNNELWKEKYMSEFSSASGAVSSRTTNWKKRFASAWENSKKRYREGRFIRTANPFGPNPFGVPQPLPGHGPNPFGVPQLLPGHGPNPLRFRLVRDQQSQYALLRMANS